MRSSCYASEITERPRITGLSVTPAWSQLGQALTERIVADPRRIGRAHITVLRQPVSPAVGAPNRPVMASADVRGGSHATLWCAELSAITSSQEYVWVVTFDTPREMSLWRSRLG